MTTKDIIKHCQEEAKRSKWITFSGCLKENKRTVAIMGLNCSGKSTLLKKLAPEVLNFQGRSDDEERFDMGITTTNRGLEDIEDIVTDIIVMQRHPREVLKCMIKDRNMAMMYNSKTTKPQDIPERDCLRLISQQQGDIIEKARNFKRNVYYGKI